MPMPETAVHKNHCLASWQHIIGSSWETLVVRDKPDAEPPQDLKHYEFGPGARALHRAHDL